MDEAAHLRRTMTSLGQVARLSTLLRLGASRGAIRRAVASGRLERPKRGWYLTHAADSDQRRAVDTGAKLGCVTALRRWGVWSGLGNELHLHAQPTASRLRVASRVRGAEPAVLHPGLDPLLARELTEVWTCDQGLPLVHWREQQFEHGALDWMVAPQDALLQAITCQGEEHALACIDSALHHGVLTTSDWARVRAHLPKRLEHLDQVKDARAGSGSESIVRLRIRRLGLRVEPQAHLPGVGDVDLLVEGLVAFEADGDRFHSSRKQRNTDRSRTMLCQAYGVPTIRVGTEQLGPAEWPLVVSALERALADARTLAGLRRP